MHVSEDVHATAEVFLPLLTVQLVDELRRVVRVRILVPDTFKYIITVRLMHTLACIFQSTSALLKRGEFQGFTGNWDHRLSDSDCWNIDILAEFTEVILVTVLVAEISALHCCLTTVTRLLHQRRETSSQNTHIIRCFMVQYPYYYTR